MSDVLVKRFRRCGPWMPWVFQQCQGWSRGGYSLLFVGFSPGWRVGRVHLVHSQQCALGCLVFWGIGFGCIFLILCGFSIVCPVLGVVLCGVESWYWDGDLQFEWTLPGQEGYFSVVKPGSGVLMLLVSFGCDFSLWIGKYKGVSNGEIGGRLYFMFTNYAEACSCD